MPSPKSAYGPQYVQLGEALQKLRKAAGLTQSQLGEGIGFRGNFVSEVERGNRGLRWSRLLDWLDACGASVHDLADALDAVTDEGR